MNLLIVCPKGRAALDALSQNFVNSHGVDVGKKWIGVVEPASFDSANALDADPGIIVLPAAHDPTPIDVGPLAHFSYVNGITANETGFTLRQKLNKHHGFAPFRADYAGRL